MSNKHLTEPPTDIAIARLKVLLSNINNTYQTEKMVLESDIVTLYSEAIDLFFASIDGSITGAIKQIYPGAPSDPSSYNLFTMAIQKDLEALFSEITSLDKLIASSFNSALAERDRILFKNKAISNKIGDYLLYADPKLGAGFFFGDSFNIADRIDAKSSLLEGDECFVDYNEGVVLLPLDGEPKKATVKSITINKPSNGEAGNNHELDAGPHSEITAIGDSEPNTWFEYEKVSVYELLYPLILDITLTLEEPTIINHININPINFGTRTPVVLKIIETSKDGKEYVSIKDEVPIKDFTSEQEVDDFILSSSTSKLAGQGFYSFLPRRVLMVHLVFEQHSPYIIDTNNGERLRYAIGLRDVEVLARAFKPTGSLISTKFSSANEIKKLSMWASENPTEASVLADIKHFVSHDDGATWNAVQPQGRDSFDLPEILNYNNNDPTSISTTEAVKTLRHKISIERNKDAFSGDAILKQERVRNSDILSIPLGNNAKLSTSQKLIKNSLTALIPFFGSFSCPRPRSGNEVLNQSIMMDLDTIEFSVDAPSTDTIRFRLPYRNIPYLENKLRVFVNGAQILYSAKDDTSIEDYDEDSKIYFINRDGLEIQFGTQNSGGEQKGFLPASGSKIQVCLDGDNPGVSITDLGYVLNLAAPSDGIKETVSIVSFKQFNTNNAREFQISIPGGTRVYRDESLQKNQTGFIKYYAEPSFSVKNNPPSNKEKVKGLKTLKIAEDKISAKKAFRPEMKQTYFESDAVKNIPLPQEGVLPPVFLGGKENFRILEYRLDGTLIEDPYFNNPVDFVNGESEITADRSYTFNHVTGAVYLSSDTASDRRTVFVCKKLDMDTINPEDWTFYRDPVTARLDTQRILLNPKAVYTQKVKTTGLASVGSIKLITNEKEHSWFNRHIVKGSVIVNKSFFAANAQPMEVTFIDGSTEFSNKSFINDEEMELTPAGNIYSYVLKGINSQNTLLEPLTFMVVREPTQTTAEDISFVTQKNSDEVLSAQGEWQVVTVDGTSTIYLYSTTVPPSHLVSYSFSSVDTGLDLNSLYSINYSDGTLYFAKQTIAAGTVEYETTLYSAFYNIAEKADYGIAKVDEAASEVYFTEAFVSKFLKQDTSVKSRPQMIKLLYEYYAKSTESLKDLEPFFSPICKDVAFKAVTDKILEEL